MQLLGINGLKTSGKDTVYKLISEELENVERAAFADTLKVAAASALGFTGGSDELIALMDSFKDGSNITMAYDFPGNQPLHGHDYYNRGSISGREYLQNFGVTCREMFGSDFWVDQILPTDRFDLPARYPGVDTLVITDVRFPNEAQRTIDLGGVIVEVLRPGLKSDGHSSEIRLAPGLIYYVMDNSGDIEELRWGVRDFLDHFLNDLDVY